MWLEVQLYDLFFFADCIGKICGEMSKGDWINRHLYMITQFYDSYADLFMYAHSYMKG